MATRLTANGPPTGFHLYQGESFENGEHETYVFFQPSGRRGPMDEGIASIEAPRRPGKEIVRFPPGKVEDYCGIAIWTRARQFRNPRIMEVIGASSMMAPKYKYGEELMARSMTLE